MECPACRAAVPEGSRFCPSCGQALASRADERRVATVLFSDLVGFTRMSEGADPEQVKNMIDRAFERLVADVVAHGGRVDKIMGDGIIALFGAPVAHEDDPERAVRAALQMQQTLDGYATETGMDVRMRIGVNTGEVLVGALRAGGDYTAMGDTMNVGSRLQEAARPGQVLVGPGTYAETKDVVRYEPLGAVQARGRDEPVDAYVALGTIAPPGHRPRRSRSPIMGREQELAMLCPSLAMAVSRHRPQVFLISGEAGMGKSRLAEELARVAATEHDALVIEGRCVPYGEANIWWPIAAALRQSLGIDLHDDAEAAAAIARNKVANALGTDEQDAEVDRTVEGLLYLLGFATSLADADPARARSEAIRALIGTLQHIARRRALVLMISELHWADELVLEVIDRLPAHMRGLPFVLILTARAELEDRWSPRPGRHDLVVVHLDALDREATRHLLASLIESEPSEELTDAVFERSGGNPFFIEELGALMQEQGGLTELPGSLRAMVSTRLDALDAAERRIVDDAAVVGRLGPLDSLLDLEPQQEPALVTRTVDRLVADDVLALDGRDWVFTSDLVREVAYETLSKAERARRHAALGAALARRHETDKDDTQVEQIAHHLGSAAELVGDLGTIDGVPPDIGTRALKWIDRAIRRAERRDLPAVALGLADRALCLMRSSTPARRQLQLRRATALCVLRRLEEARAEARSVLVEGRDAGDERAVAGAQTVLGRIEMTEEAWVEAAASLDQAIDSWRTVADKAGEADALRWRGQVDHLRGRLATAQEFLTAALELYHEVEDRTGTAWAQQTLAWIAFTGGDFEEAERRLAESMRLFEESNDRGGWSWAAGLLGWIRQQQGYIDDADRIAMEVLHGIDREGADGVGHTHGLAREGDQWALGMMVLLLATTRLWRGMAREAVDLAREAVAKFTSINDETGKLRSFAVLGRALLAAGPLDEARMLLAEARERAKVETEPEVKTLMLFVIQAAAVELGEGVEASLEQMDQAMPLSAFAEVPRGMALLQVGRVDEAVEVMAAAYESAQDPGLQADAGSALAFVLAAAGRPERAREVAAEFTAEQGTYRDQINLHYARGFAAAQLGEPAVAMGELHDAVALADTTQDVLAQSLTRLARARLLAEVGEPGAAERALDAAYGRLAHIGLPHTTWNSVFRSAAALARV